MDEQTTPDQEKDPAEQEALARDLGADLTDAFVQFVRGEIDFADVSFAAYDVLQDLHIVGSGAYELVEEAEAEDADDYSDESATEQQEELAQEPARG